MKISLPYDNNFIDLDLKDFETLTVVGDRYPQPLHDTRESLVAALENAIGSKSLGDIVPDVGGVAVLIADVTRGGCLGPVLLDLLGYLEERGAGPDRVEIMLAAGMHRGHTAGELRTHLGPDIVSRWTIVEHRASDESGLTLVGMRDDGEPYLFNERIVDAALVICVGTVSFHYFAGFGGGRKLILPGVAGERTILANHRLSLKEDPGEGLAAGCESGNLEGNPVHEDMLAGARMLPAPVFAVNVVPDGEDGICFINAGDLAASHANACVFLRDRFRIPLAGPYMAVVCSAGGAPRDINLLQSHKAIRHASSALEEGGVLLGAAACPDGIGSPSLEAAFGDGRERVRANVRKAYTLNAQTAISLLDLSSRYSIYLRSDLPAERIASFGFCTLEDGYISCLLKGLRPEEILVIRNAATFLPFIEKKP